MLRINAAMSGKIAAFIPGSLFEGKAFIRIQWPVVTQSPFAELSELNHQTKSSTYSTNAIAVIRTGRQNGVALEVFLIERRNLDSAV